MNEQDKQDELMGRRKLIGLKAFCDKANSSAPKPVAVPPPSPQPQEAACTNCGREEKLHTAINRFCLNENHSVQATTRWEPAASPDARSDAMPQEIEPKAIGCRDCGYPNIPSIPTWCKKDHIPLALSDATPQEDTPNARSWHKVHGRPDVLGVRTLASGQREYLMHNEALSQPYYVVIEEKR